MSIFDIMDKHIGAAQARWPDAFEFGGNSFACTKVSLTKRETAIVETMFVEDSVSLSLQVQESLFSKADPVLASPKEDDSISYKGENYRVLTVFTPPHDLIIKLVLTEEYGE